jgi:hypothetical protein
MNEISTNTSASKSNVPAYIKGVAKMDDSLFSGIGSGFPVVSIRGRAWRIVTNGVEDIVTLPDSDDPAPSIEVVVLKGNKGTSKVFYASAYVEGSDSKPDCFSNDGVAPDAQVEHPQSSRCATCKQNVWGSKITPQGTKTKACSDSRRLAIAPAGDLQNPMLLSTGVRSTARVCRTTLSLPSWDSTRRRPTRS